MKSLSPFEYIMTDFLVTQTVKEVNTDLRAPTHISTDKWYTVRFLLCAKEKLYILYYMFRSPVAVWHYWKIDRKSRDRFRMSGYQYSIVNFHRTSIFTDARCLIIQRWIKQVLGYIVNHIPGTCLVMIVANRQCLSPTRVLSIGTPRFRNVVVRTQLISYLYRPEPFNKLALYMPYVFNTSI